MCVRHTLKATLLTAALASSARAQTTVFNFDGESGIPTQINPGVAQLEGVQGYAGLGPAGDQFAGSFLRSPTGNVVTLTLNNLPAHTSIDVLFLFAAIDSLDGTGTYPEGDYLRIAIDGTPFFRESFANASLSQIQSYVPPPGVELARHVDLGFSGPGGYYTDSAYDLALDPRFSNIPHTASSAVITFIIEGPGIQSLDDESWALDNLRIRLGNACPADLDDGSGQGVRDNAVDINDLLYFLVAFESGAGAADLDDGSGTGTPDGGVNIDDLLFFLVRFEAGC